MKHMYVLEDEQNEMLKDLVKSRIHVELQFFSEKEEHETLDYIDMCSMLKDLGGLLQALNEKYVNCEAGLTLVALPPDYPKDAFMERPKDPVPDPPSTSDEEPEEVPKKKYERDGGTCRNCVHCSGFTGKGRGTKYTCELSGAEFGPDLGCDAFKRKKKQ